MFLHKFCYFEKPHHFEYVALNTGRFHMLFCVLYLKWNILFRFLSDNCFKSWELSCGLNEKRRAFRVRCILTSCGCCVPILYANYLCCRWNCLWIDECGCKLTCSVVYRYVRLRISMAGNAGASNGIFQALPLNSRDRVNIFAATVCFIVVIGVQASRYYCKCMAITIQS